jgi:hypothetical protein
VNIGQTKEAATLAEQAQSSDPLSLLSNFGPGSILVFTRQWNLAKEG